MRITLCLQVAVLFLPSSACAADSNSPPETKAWIRHVIPLPREIDFEGFVTVRPTDVAVRLCDESSDVERAAAELLRGALAARPAAATDLRDSADSPDAAAATVASAATEPPTSPTATDSESGRGAARIELRLVVCSAAGRLGDVVVPGADKLAAKPNREQAYVIAPISPDTLALTGLDERGVYYAALTLAQLLETQRTADRVTVPLVRVLDWPDLAERGGWGGSMSSDIRWMAAHKLNLAEVQATLSIAEDGTGRAALDPALVEHARLHAFRIVPIITHLEQLMSSGLFTRFPETRGVGPKAKLPGYEDHQVPCSFQPRFRALLGQWMTDLARIKGVDTICVWLSENDLQCGCDQCLAIGQFAAETRACVNAWRIARQTKPDLKLRILLTQGSYRTNDKVLAEAPPEVQISYYDGGRTYNSSRDPMIYPLMEQAARDGRWLGVYPQVTASWRIVCPWSGPQFMKSRMTEFVDKRLSNVCAYATPHNRLYDFNVTAVAEWGWNAHGRDEREFAAAWATRRGLKDPELAAEWAVLLGSVGWDVYGSGVPYPQFFGRAADMVRRRSAPVLGQGPFRYFATPERFHEAATAVARAATLADQLGDPALCAETQVIGGYVTMLARLYDIAAFVSRQTPPSDAERHALNDDLLAFALAEWKVNEGLRAWEAATLGRPAGERFTDTQNVNDQTLVEVSEALAPFGVRNPLAAYLTRQIGQYETGDFEATQSAQKVLDVTSVLDGPGEYQVRFTHTKGYIGATVSRVALVGAPRDPPENRTELAVDAHRGVIGYTPTDPVYTLRLTTHDDALRYYVVADLTAPRSGDKPAERGGCNGTITFWKVRQPGEELRPLPLLPMAPTEKTR